ncbi:signal transduction histidine kinase [Methanohalophilus levihalophilus]|uniref:sensor histidine kinase n=1 Tax=Methanohalophilus levihalophilus TaxID=1431282 RepID=UPI001AE78730|nr:sensor histidine kinase [Methanohalophilus levihalophilus]MBP2031284.1 signal transduction histidine kinase [Methanohalophilus levihalophilus]
MLFRKRKLNVLIILFIAFLFISSIIFFGTRANQEVQEIFEEQFTRQQTLVAMQISSGISEFLNEKFVALEIAANYENGVPPDNFSRHFEAIYNHSAGFYALEFVDKNGTIVSGYPEENVPLGYNLYENERAIAFEKTKEIGTTYVTDPIESIEGDLTIFVWVPVYKEKEFQGTILALIHTEEITKRVIREYNASSGYIYIIDSNGKLLYDSSEDYYPGDNYFDLLSEPDHRRLFILGEQVEGNSGSGWYRELNENGEEEIRLVSYVPIEWHNQVWSVGVVTPLQDIIAIIRTVYLKQATFMLSTGFFILFFSALMVLIFASWNRTLEDEVARKTAELEKSNRHLRKLDRLKNEFLSMVSHELKTPLTAMRTSSEFLKEGKCDSETQDEMLDLIIRNIDRQSRMVDDLLDISRIESEKMTFKEEKVDIAEAIHNAMEVVRSKAEKKKIHLEIDDMDLPAARTDKDKLIRTLVNLLDNAIKFTPYNGEAIQISGKTEDDFLRLTVADKGTGFPAEEIEKIFDKFYQIDSTATRKAGGTGLGLAIIKGIVEGQGGRISVTSDPGNGSTFTFTIRKWVE